MAGERKRITSRQEAGGLSEAHWALAQQLAHIGSWELDLTDLKNINRNPLRWSEETFRLLGYQPGQVKPTNDLFFKAVHPDDRQKIEEAVARAVREYIPYNIEHRVVWPDGTVRMLHEQSTILYDDDGKPLKMLGVVRDVTDRKRSDASVEHHARILHHVGDSVVVCDLDGRVTFWNKGAQALYGYTAEEMLGHSLMRICPISETSRLQADLKTVQAGRELSLEYEGLHKNGSRVWVDLRISLLKDADGHPLGLIHVAKDVTRRKQDEEADQRSERLYQAIGECVEYGAWLADPKGRIHFFSDSFIRLLGITPKQNLTDAWINALRPQERDAILTAWRQCIRTQTPWSRTYQIIGVDGQYHSILMRGAPVRDPDGSVVCWAGLNLRLDKLK